MWQELSCVHRRTKTTPRPGENVWRTCLRELEFLEPGAAAEGEIYSGIAAHRFLVEICSGLHSPLFGETEVFGQFKAFRDAQDWHPAWSSFFEAVEEDARKLRNRHLKDIGSQSYGSLARRHLPEGKPVVLVGGGRLALDLLPWLKNFEVTVAVRDPSRWKGAAPAVELDRIPAQHGASWILAAPVANETVFGLWASSNPGVTLDFRGETQLTGPVPGTYFSLKSLYGELANVKQLHERKRAEALAFARELSELRASRFALSAVHRPFGWEDAYP